MGFSAFNPSYQEEKNPSPPPFRKGRGRAAGAVGNLCVLRAVASRAGARSYSSEELDVMGFTAFNPSYQDEKNPSPPPF